MQETSQTPLAPSHDPRSLRAATAPRIAVISAQWHFEIVGRGCDALCAELRRQHWPSEAIDRYEVPGAFEIPLRAAQLARAGHHAAIVAVALVVDGGIYRHDFVASSVIDGLMRVQLDSGVPVLSMVLTPQAFHEHAEHQQFFAEHFAKKGTEAARACLAVLACQPTAA